MNPAESILRSLLRYDRPPDELLTELAGSGEEEWTPAEGEDAELEVVFAPEDVVAVLAQFLEGELDNEALEEWAAVVDSRQEVVYEPEHEEALRRFMSEVGHMTAAEAEEWLEEFDDD